MVTPADTRAGVDCERSAARACETDRNFLENEMKMKTSELTGAALDWAVAKCEGYASGCGGVVPYSTDWSQGGPIIEREGLTLTHQADRWAAQTDADLFAYGPTPLIAAMRCYVASKLGDDVDVPQELC